MQRERLTLGLNPPGSGAMCRPQSDLGRDLIAAYLFNVGTGKKVPDVGCNGLDLTVASGTPGFTGGLTSSAGRFTGANLDLWTKTGIKYYPPPFTLACEFITPSIAAAQILISHDSNANNGYRLSISLSVGTYQLLLGFGGVSNYGFSSTLEVVANQWYRAMLVCPANLGVATGYLMNMTTGMIQSGTATVGTIAGTPNRLAVGLLQTTTQPFTGSLAWVYWWNRALIPDDAERLLRRPYSLFTLRQRQPGYQFTPTFQAAFARQSNRLISGGVWGG